MNRGDEGRYFPPRYGGAERGGAGLEYYYIYRGIMPSIKIPMPRIIDAIGTRDASHARQHMA